MLVSGEPNIGNLGNEEPGKPVKFELTTYGYPYFRAADKGTVQHLSINSYGHVKFSEFDKDLKSSKSVEVDAQQKSIDKDIAIRIIYMVADICGQLGEILANDGDIDSEFLYSNAEGSWNIRISDSLGNIYSYQGFYGMLKDIVGFDPSEYIREELDMYNLLAFNGKKNNDRIDRVTIYLDRTIKVNYSDGEDKTPTYDELIEYHERMVVDRAGMYIEHDHGIEGNFKSYQKIELGHKLKDFLNSFDADSFFMNFNDESTKSSNKPNDYSVFRIEIVYKDRGVREISGSFDRKGLPIDWMDFSDGILKFHIDFGLGDILVPDVMRKNAPDVGEVIYVSVRFKHSYSTYYYITDDEEITIGDHVLVPVGKENKEVEAVVEDVEYFKRDEVPYPLDKIKRVIARR